MNLPVMDIEQIELLFIEYGLSVVGAIIILVIGLTAAKWIARRTEQYLKRTDKVDDTLTPLFAKIVKILIIIFTVLAVLNQFGVQTASIVALLGAIGLAIGLAMQGTLSNIASGVMLLTLRPFHVGEAVNISGTVGVIDEIGLFVTQLHTFDNIAVTMPNSQIWSSKIENFSRNPTRRVNLEFGIAYDDDIDKAMRVVNEVLSQDERVMTEPKPLVAVNGLGDNSVLIRVWPWTETANFWPLRYDLIKRIKERFDEEDISFPFPQRDVHLVKEENQ